MITKKRESIVLGILLLSLGWLACSNGSPDTIRLGTIQFPSGEEGWKGLPVRYPCVLNDILPARLSAQEDRANGLPEGYHLVLKGRNTVVTEIPVQWDSDTLFPWEKRGSGALVWLMEDLSPDDSAQTYDLLLKRGTEEDSTLNIKDHAEDYLVLRTGQKPVMQYNYGIVQQVEGESGPYDRAAYIHPVWTPDGRVITGDFSPEHIHQRGLFMAFRRVRFGEMETDFWGLGESSGRILPDERKPEYSTGPVLAKIEIHNRGDVSGKTHFKEVWGIRVYKMSDSEFWLFDVVVRLLPVDPKRPGGPASSSLEMVLEKLHYSGMSFRGPSNWLHRESQDVARALAQGIEFTGVRWLPPDLELDVITSEGKTRADGDGEAARWVDYTGPSGDGWGGLAMFSHRENLRHPMPLRIHPELPYFSFALTRDAPLTVCSDRSLDQRFRVLVHDGHPDPVLNERIGSAYENPVKVIFVSSD
jgi:hypothetical protein